MENQETIELLKNEEDMSKRTDIFLEWLKSQTDDIKLSYAINWKMAHTIFSVSRKYFKSDVLQNIDWYKIYKNKNIGYFSNGNKVICV